MVIFSSLGDASIFIRESAGKKAIKKVEHANPAIRDAVLDKVTNNTANISHEEKREQALLDVRKANILFRDAVDVELRKLLPRPS